MACEESQSDRLPGTVIPIFDDFLFYKRTSPDFGNTPIFRRYLLIANETPEVASEEVLITVRCKADIAGPTKGLNVEANGVIIGRLFYLFEGEVHGGVGLGCTPIDVTEIRIPAFEFNNQIRNNGYTPVVDQVIFDLQPFGTVDQRDCNDVTWAELTLEYLYESGETSEPIDLKLWSEDICQNVVMIPAMRPPEHMDVEPQGIFAPRAGYFDLFSLHTGRWITGFDPPQAFDDEPCTYGYGVMTLSSKGYGQPLFCSNQEPHIPGGKENHVLTAFLHFPDQGLSEDDRLSDIIPPGYGGFIGGYRAPDWFEAIFHSHQQLCEPPFG